MADLKYLDTLEEVLLERGFPLDIVQSVLETAQTVDAVPVVRCRECKWYQIRRWNDTKAEYDCRKTNALLDVSPEDFCSYGERKDGDGNG